MASSSPAPPAVPPDSQHTTTWMAPRAKSAVAAIEEAVEDGEVARGLIIRALKRARELDPRMTLNQYERMFKSVDRTLQNRASQSTERSTKSEEEEEAARLKRRRSEPIFSKQASDEIDEAELFPSAGNALACENPMAGANPIDAELAHEAAAAA